jgi:hypothetical protein
MPKGGDADQGMIALGVELIEQRLLQIKERLDVIVKYVGRIRFDPCRAYHPLAHHRRDRLTVGV